MRKTAKLMTAVFTIALFMTAALPMRAAASDYAANPAAVNETTGYKAYIYDWEDLLTGEEEEALVSDMMPVTQYGGAAFVTDEVSAGTSKTGAERMYRELFGTGSGTLFLIDMGNRNLWIFSDGAIYQTVTGSYADTITDNVYKLAVEGQYYECAKGVFEQEARILGGGRIARPMKYITNALIALIFALLFNYAFVRWTCREHAPIDTELIAAVAATFVAGSQNAVHTGSKRVYDPPVSSSSGGGGGGGGGGGHSGGGGGHSF